MLEHCMVLILVLQTQAEQAERGGLRPLFDAIRQVESGGRRAARNGNHYGPYQVNRRWWLDACQAAGWKTVNRNFRADAANPFICERLMFAYWFRFCPEALAAHDFRTLARVHNGGPGGARLRSTVGYWLRVRAALRGPG